MAQALPPVLPVRLVSIAPLLLPPQVSALQAATEVPLEEPSRETALPALQETTVLPAQSTQPIAVLGHMSPAQEGQTQPLVLPVLLGSTALLQPPPQVSALQAATGAPLEEPNRETALPVLQETTALPAQSTQPTAVLGHMSPVQEELHLPPVLPVLQASTVPLLPRPQVSALQAATGAPLEEPSKETALHALQETTALPTLSILPIAVLGHMSPVQEGQPQPPVLPALQASTVPLLPPPQVSALQAATGAPLEEPSRETAPPVPQETTAQQVLSIPPTAVLGPMSPVQEGQPQPPVLPVLQVNTAPLLPPPQVSAQQAATGAPQGEPSKETAPPAPQETTVLPVQSTRSTAVQGHTSPALGAARLAPACHVHRLTTVLLLPPAPHSALPTPTPWGVPLFVRVVLVTP